MPHYVCSMDCIVRQIGPGRQQAKRLSEHHTSNSAGRSGFSVRRITAVQAFLAESWERLWPRLVPFFIVLTVFLTVSWIGLWQVLPDWARWIGVAAFMAAFIAALLPLRGYKFPTRTDLLRRIELASGFVNRPVTAQVDEPAGTADPAALALWREHQRRMARQLDNLAAGHARPNGNLFDRYALRAILPIFAFIALGYSFSLNGGSVRDAFERKLDTREILSRLDVWLTPPSYTARAPVYLSAITGGTDGSGNPLPAPLSSAVSGSELAIRYVGKEPVSARLVAGQAANVLEPGDESPDNSGNRELAFAATLKESAVVEILARDRVIASWPVDISPDLVPSIELTQPPGRSVSGALELTYKVEDDFGVISARGVITRIDAADSKARPLVEPPELPLPLPRARAKSGETKVNRDFSSHPWAGSEVELVLEATDDPGQIGRSLPVKVVLPGRTFTDPMARALVEQRRILALDANDALLVANLLDAVTTHADVFELEMGAFLALQSAYRKIAGNESDDELREAMDILWETALALELGDLSEVERKLREAQEKLSEALENGATDEEIERLMDELRQAMNDYLEQLAREMAENPIEQNPLSSLDPSQTLTQRDLERMMQRIEDLARSGSKDAARELLAEMQRMMDNLRAGRHQQQRQAEGNQLNQALDKLSELMQRQEQLMNETFSMQQRRPRPNLQQPPQSQQGQQQQQGQQGEEGNQQPMTEEEFAEAMRQLREQQEALEQQLSELGQQLENLGLDPSQEFGEAGQEMGEAGRNLGDGEPGAAAGDQGQALEALRRGAQSMMQQMAGDRGQNGSQPGQGQNGQQRMGGTDPLGRSNGPNGQMNTEDTRIPDEIDAQRAREIMDAIRKRLSDPLRPLLERNYLDRLLQSR